MKQDELYMQRALKLAKKGGRAVAPNPMVGAVIVSGGKIIGEGYHQVFGGPHAEVNAIDSVENPEDLKGATIYVTLEPCRHQGKTPACLSLLNQIDFKNIIVGSRDPFQQEFPMPNAQCSMQYLHGPIADQCRELNRFFFTWVEKKRPFITVKVAITADGFVAGLGGKPIRITSPEQDKQVHQMRADHQAILVGTNTVLNDDPQLNVRHVPGVDPLRIVLDQELKIPLESKVFRDSNALVATKQWTSSTRCPLSVHNKIKWLKEKGIQALEGPEKEGKIDLGWLFKKLAQQGIASVLVEPGPTLYRSLKKLNLIDELIVLKGEVKIDEGLRIEI